MINGLKIKSSIYGKLRAIIARVLVSAFFLLLVLLSIQDIYKSYQKEQVQLKLLAEIIASNINASLLFKDAITAKQTLGVLALHNAPIQFASVVDKDHTIFITYGDASPTHSVWQTIDYKQAIIVDGSKIGDLYIVASLSNMWQAVVTDLLMLTLVLIGAFIFALILVPEFASSIVDPIKKLAETARIITKTQKYSIRTEKYSDDEVGQLTDTVNEMLDLIEQRDNDIRIAATAFNTQEAIIITDADKNIIRVNPAYTKITGYNLVDVAGKTPLSLTANPQFNETSKEIDKSIVEKDFWTGELIGIHKNGYRYPAEYMINVVRNASNDITNYVMTFTDISERVASEEKIRHLAFYDSLTSLPNRRLLIERLKLALKTSERHDYYGALFFLDLDKFKILNDSKGHHYGDILLTEVSRRLSGIVRSVDTVARLGGDEFVIMIERLDQDQRLAMAEANMVGNKIVSILNEPYLLDDFSYTTSSSVGVTLFHSNDNDIATLLSQADTAMYAAKNAGRNTLRFFGDELQEAIEQRILDEQALRVALDKQQFELYYQIQVNNHGRAEGAELLIRWHHPSRGLVAPSEFIPLAEELQLIKDIGRWVIEEACQQLTQWQKDEAKKHLILAINISAVQFQDDHFVSDLLQIVKNCEINPQKLNLELTETVVIQNVEIAILKMKQLKAAGINIAMDDFGTGYSSLNYVSRLPVSQIKIDRSFIARALNSSHDRLIIKMVIALGHMLNINVVAEGIEGEEQFELLKEMGCDLYQGFYIGNPMPRVELELVLENNYLAYFEAGTDSHTAVKVK